MRLLLPDDGAQPADLLDRLVEATGAPPTPVPCIGWGAALLEGRADPSVPMAPSLKCARCKQQAAGDDEARVGLAPADSPHWRVLANWGECSWQGLGSPATQAGGGAAHDFQGRTIAVQEIWAGCAQMSQAFGADHQS